METVNVHDAKPPLSKLLERVEAGEEVIIARAGKPVARLTQLVPATHAIRFGVLKGKVRVATDFDAPVTASTCQPHDCRGSRGG